MQCDNHICSVKYVKYLYSANCHMVDCSDFIWDTYVYASCIEVYQIFVIYDIYAQFGAHNCFWHMFGNNVRSMYCGWLCFSTCGKMLDLYTHLICLLCDLHMQCSSHISSVI